MNRRSPIGRLSCAAGALLFSFICAAATADDRAAGVRRVTSMEALALAEAHHPGLRASRLEMERARESVRAAEGLNPFFFGADAGFTHSSTPQGNSLYYRRDEVSLGAGVWKTFNVGTRADLRLEGAFYETGRPPTATAVDPGNVPNLGLSGRLTLTQPLIRGAGKTVTLAALRQARAEQTLAEKAADVAAGELAASVLHTYWDLWLAERALDINRRSRDEALHQLEEIRERVAMGAAAAVDRISYETALAGLEETVIESEAEVRRLETGLAEQVGLTRTTARLGADPQELPSMRDNVPTAEALEKEALERSPAIHEAFAALAAAKERALTAGESMRHQLDLQGWIEGRTLARDEVAPVFTDFGRGAAWSAYVGLHYELPLDRRKREGDRAVARIDVKIAAERLDGVSNQVCAAVRAARDRLDSARQRLEKGKETVALSQSRMEAEQERYRLGVSTFTSVRDAEETVRQAELRMTRAQVDVVRAWIELDLLTGVLTENLWQSPTSAIPE